MLTKVLLKKIWLIIEQLEEEVLDLTDLELIHTIESLILIEVVLDRTEIKAISEYIQPRVPIIRDLVEVQSIKFRKGMN
ncbi:MAG: hypothetical protein AAGF83_25265 [Cyanobacteria bacterium P01_G01_bin.67]